MKRKYLKKIGAGMAESQQKLLDTLLESDAYKEFYDAYLVVMNELKLYEDSDFFTNEICKPFPKESYLRDALLRKKNIATRALREAKDVLERKREYFIKSSAYENYINSFLKKDSSYLLRDMLSTKIIYKEELHNENEIPNEKGMEFLKGEH